MDKNNILQILSERIRQKLMAKGASPNSIESSIRQAFRFYDVKETDYLTVKAFIGSIERLGVWLTPQEQEMLRQEIDPGMADKVPYAIFIARLRGPVETSFTRQESSSDRKFVTTSEEQKALDFLRSRLKKQCLLPVLGMLVKNDNLKTGMLDLEGIRKTLVTATRYDFNDSLYLLRNRYDSNLLGKYDYYAILEDIAGGMSKNRHAVASDVFKRFTSGSDKVPVWAFIKNINFDGHPDILSRAKSRSQMEQEVADGLKTLSEFKGCSTMDLPFFIAYANFLSAPIDSDDYFKLFMENLFKGPIENIQSLTTSDRFPVADQGFDRQALSILSRSHNMEAVQPALDKIKSEFFIKGLGFMLGFVRILKSSESPKSKELDLDNFKLALSNCKLPVSPQEQEKLFLLFRKHGQDCLNLEEFLSHLIPAVTASRQQKIHLIFDSFEGSRQGRARVVDVKRDFNPVQLSSKNKPDLVYMPSKQEFDYALDNYLFIQKNKTEFISKDQFLDFYKYLSFFYQSEEAFDQVLKQCWKKFAEAGELTKPIQLNANINTSHPPYGVTTDDKYSQSSGRHFDRNKISHDLDRKGYTAGVSSAQLHLQRDKQNRYQPSNPDNTSSLRNDGTTEKILPNDRPGDTHADPIAKLATGLKEQNEFGVFLFLKSLRKADGKGMGVVDRAELSNAIRVALKTKSLDEAWPNALSNQFAEKSGKVDYVRILESLIQTVRSSDLARITSRSYKVLDIFKSGSVSLDVIRSRFVSSQHPKVLAGRVKDYDLHQSFVDALQDFAEYRVR